MRERLEYLAKRGDPDAIKELARLDLRKSTLVIRRAEFPVALRRRSYDHGDGDGAWGTGFGTSDGYKDGDGWGNGNGYGWGNGNGYGYGDGYSGDSDGGGGSCGDGYSDGDGISCGNGGSRR